MKQDVIILLLLAILNSDGNGCHVDYKDGGPQVVCKIISFPNKVWVCKYRDKEKVRSCRLEREG